MLHVTHDRAPLPAEKVQRSVLARLALLSFRHRRVTLAAWAAAVAVAATLAVTLGSSFNTVFALSNAEAERARTLLSENGLVEQSGEAGLVVFASDQGVLSPEVTDVANEVLDRIRSDVAAVSVGASPFQPGGQAQVSPSGRVGFVEVDLGSGSSEVISARAEEVVEAAQRVDTPNVTVEFGGEPFYEEAEFSSEGIGLLAAVVILLFAFGSVLAMGLPIGTALFGIGTAVGVLTLLSRVLDVPDFAVPVTAMVGIGVGIDYALFIVTRYRESLHDGATPEAAMVRSIDTAGRSVLFAGSTVVLSLLGLLLVDLAAIRTAALAAALGVLFVMAASLTLLPALLGFAGTGIDRLRLPGRRTTTPSATDPASFWYRWSRAVQRRPLRYAVGGIVVLLIAAAPTLSLRLGFSDAGNRLASDTSKRAYDLVAGDFGPGYNGPLILAVDLTDAVDGAVVMDGLGSALQATSGVASVLPGRLGAQGAVGTIELFPTTSPQDAATAQLVDRLRTDVIPDVLAGTGGRALVGGPTAAAADFSDYILSRLSVLIGTVLLLSFILLTVLFRSVLVPFKAVIMNLLSVGAAYGVLVAVFQWGWGAHLLGVGEPGPIEAWAPLMLFAIVFGLSMDYEVFLLSRIREQYQRTGNNSLSVADGVASTARLITAAAAIMVCVFGAFILSGERALQIFGLGLAVAVLVDATIVRLIIVPATMELLGDRNWWFPKILRRLLPTQQPNREVLTTP